MFPDLDPRFLLARSDLAELALEGLVVAERYAPTRALRCVLGFAPIRDEAGEQVGEILFGEVFDVLEDREALSWGRARRDGTVGYVDSDLLETVSAPATHRVATTEAALPLNALVTDADEVEPEHLTDFLTFDTDLASAAERLLGAPYHRRGRSRAGVDSGGLVQQALLACGKAGPRPSDLQARLGDATTEARRGDLLVWIGNHAGIAVDDTRLIHACPQAGRVLIEAIQEVDARWRALGAGAPVIRRL
ncbi:NlpC/P60 family protein [Brevundimonas aveniformis]|uniref:C40 family peptidase n=1 Tax=Brevundimonas aveniformis TaxID=370977 RepID=UPI0024906827|nr:NlpC/P60 family protein [Brevundimonas aveniformis]